MRDEHAGRAAIQHRENAGRAAVADTDQRRHVDGASGQHHHVDGSPVERCVLLVKDDEIELHAAKDLGGASGRCLDECAQQMPLVAQPLTERRDTQGFSGHE